MRPRKRLSAASGDACFGSTVPPPVRRTQNRRGATLPAGSRRMRTREKRPAYRSIFQNAALYGASSLPPPKSCVSPVMRSTAVPQPASKWAV